ncbi:hypothetical protein BC827DRAFT_1215868 [Russula dissimulans]|nr:hypothetical protein BC827DRAFT_1215868 [Russula dissimulans]
MPINVTFKLIAVILSLCILCSSSPAQLQAPPCAVSCARSAASQAPCENSYQVTCFCNNLQFQETVKACISQDCHPTDTPAASEYIAALCSIRTAGSANTSSSDL